MAFIARSVFPFGNGPFLRTTFGTFFIALPTLWTQRRFAYGSVALPIKLSEASDPKGWGLVRNVSCLVAIRLLGQAHVAHGEMRPLSLELPVFFYSGFGSKLGGQFPVLLRRRH